MLPSGDGAIAKPISSLVPPNALLYSAKGMLYFLQCGSVKRRTKMYNKILLRDRHLLEIEPEIIICFYDLSVNVKGVELFVRSDFDNEIKLRFYFY